MPYNVRALFDHLKNLYPGGVPKRFIKKEAGAELFEVLWEAREKPLLLLLKTSRFRSEGLWSGTEGELFKAAIEKGLKIGLSQVTVLQVEPEALSQDWLLKPELQEKSESSNPKCIVVLGSELGAALGFSPGASTGNWFSLGGFPLVVTHSVAEVAADLRKKKEFWFDLIAVIEKIGKTI